MHSWTVRDDWVLFEPYAGYQHFVPRVASWLVVRLTPVEGSALGVGLAACLLVGTISALVYVYSRDILDVPVCRLGLAVVPILLPLAAHEAAGNLANLHSYLLYLVPFVLLATARSTAGGLAMAVVAASAALTEIQAAILVPLAVWRMVRGRRARPVGVAFLLGVAAQVVSYLATARARGEACRRSCRRSTET